MVKQQILEKGGKSALVREYISQHPEANATAIAKLIKQDRGIDVSTGMIYNIISTEKAKGQNRKSPTRTAKTPLTADLVNLPRLAKIVKDCGGFDATRQMLKIIEDMQISVGNSGSES